MVPKIDFVSDIFPSKENCIKVQIVWWWCEIYEQGQVVLRIQNSYDE